MAQSEAHSKKYEMFVIAFEAENRAREARLALQELDHTHYLDLKESSVITREVGGKIWFDDSSDQNFTVPRALANATRILISILSLPLGLPEMSAPIADKSSASGIIRDLGFKSVWLEELGSKLQPGTSALVALVKIEHVEACRKLAAELVGGHLLQHTLTDEHYQQIATALD